MQVLENKRFKVIFSLAGFGQSDAGEKNSSVCIGISGSDS